jgi:gamma-glutamyl-gamma-aminobutyrate hydrolase PuuD
MQLFNVYQGGTLIFDIPTVTGVTGHAKVQGIVLINAQENNI